MRMATTKWTGVAGLVLVMAAALLYTVRGAADLTFWLPFGVGAACILAYAALNRQDLLQLFTSRKTRYGANSVFLVLMALAAIAFLQAIISNHDKSWDLSKGQVHTLSDEAVKAVKNLGSGIQVYAFYGPTEARAAEFEDLLKRVKKVNPSKFSYEFVDMNKNPLIAQKYAVRSLGTSVIVAGVRSESISSGKEEDLVNALLKVGSTGSKTIYVLSGHGEKFVEDTQPTGLSELKRGLESSTFSVKALNLSQISKVPEDCTALILAGPRSDYLGPELAILDEYLGRGGRVIIALDPRVKVSSLISWLKKSGINVGNDVVVDFNPVNQLFGGSPIAPIIANFDRSHPITKDMAEQRSQMIVPIGRSVSLASPMPSGVQGTVLATTFGSAWAYRGTSDNIPTKATAADGKGPLTVAVAVEKTQAGKPARLVALGSSGILGNQGIAMFNNQDFTINAVRWLADEEKRIAIAPKNAETVPLTLDKGAVALVWWSLGLLCLGPLLLGVIVTLRRKRAL